MKQKKYLMMTTVMALSLLFVLPTMVIGQNQTVSDYPFIYGYDADIPYYSPSQNDIYPIQLYPISNEFTVRKKSGIQKDDIETLIKQHLTDAQIEWYYDQISQEYDVCSVVTERTDLDNTIGILLNNNTVLFASRKYTRKAYKDLMDMWPVSEVATYGFTGAVAFTYLNNDIVESADALIESMGLEIVYRYNKQGSAVLTRPMDIFAVANQLQESGYFLLATPGMIKKSKMVTIQPIDYSTLPWFYNTNGNKTYCYELPDRFLLKKDSTVTKAVLESLISSYVQESEIIWNNKDICTIITSPEKVETALNGLMTENSVLRVSHSYFNKGSYELALKRGTSIPSSFEFDGKVSISFKENITETEKADLIRNYGLNLSLEKEDINYLEYEVPKAADVLDVSKSIFETGLVRYCIPCTTNEPKVILWNQTMVIDSKVSEIETKYYDLQGHSINKPSGLTIVVTRYSDGSVHTEKLLYR